MVIEMDKISLCFGYGLVPIDEKSARDSAAYNLSSNLYRHHERPVMTYPKMGYHMWSGDILCFPIYQSARSEYECSNCVGEMYCEVVDNTPGRIETEKTLFTKKIKAFRVTPPQIILKAPDGTVFPLIKHTAVIENDFRYYGYTFTLSADFHRIIRSFCWCEINDKDSIFCTEATRYAMRLSDERRELAKAMNIAKEKYRVFWQEQQKRKEEQARREAELRNKPPVSQIPSEMITEEQIRNLLNSLAK